MRIDPNFDRIIDEKDKLPKVLHEIRDSGDAEMTLFELWAGESAICQIVKNLEDEIIVIAGSVDRFGEYVSIRVLRWFKPYGGKFDTPSIDEEFYWPIDNDFSKNDALKRASAIISLMKQSMWYSDAFKVHEKR